MVALIVAKCTMETPVNRGTGAGGAQTNVNGKSFEEKTLNRARLLANGFSERDGNTYLANDDGSIVYLSQGALKKYFKNVFKIEMFRCPDEAYLIRRGDRYLLKILEKKNQNVAGSVDTKLLAGPGFIEEYKECLGPQFDVEYAFCLSAFLKKSYVSDQLKYTILRRINARHGIQVFFGDDADYFTHLDEWLRT